MASGSGVERERERERGRWKDRGECVGSSFLEDSL